MVGTKARAIPAPGQAGPSQPCGTYCLHPVALLRSGTWREVPIVPVERPRGSLPGSPGAEAQIN